MKSLLKSTLLTAALALFAGCASTGYQQANTTSISLQEAAQSIDETLEPLDVVLVALDDLMNNPGEDITAQFQTYSSAVSELENTVAQVKNHSQEMRTQGDAYFQNWEAELSKIQNNDIQSRSRERKIAMAEDFRGVSNRYSQTRDDLVPFVSGLVDIRTALGTDLTEAGLGSLDGLLRDANRDAARLRDSLIELSADFKEMGIALSAAMPSA